MKTKARSKAILSLLLVAVLLNIQPAFSYTFNGYEVRDLIADDLADELKSWTASKAINSAALSTLIDGKKILGGPNVLGTATAQSGDSFARTYKTLPKHNMIHFSLTLSVCGAWSADGIKLMFDSATVDRLEFNAKDFVAGKCGAAGAGLTDVVVSGRIPHSLNTLTFKAVSDVKKPSSQASFGIRELNLLFVTAATTAVKTEVCCSSASCSTLSKQCSCSLGSYLPTSSLTGTAAKCTAGSPLCGTCFGASASECYCCAKGTFWDGTKCCACDESCAECTGAGPTKCTKPKVVCIKDAKGACVDSCPAPLILDSVAKTCSSRCDTSKFIYPDGSCKDTCTTGNVLTIGCYKLCLGCKVGFITCDGGCSTTCIPPAKIRQDCGIGYCDWPCPKDEFYWPENKKDTCVGDCPCPWQCAKDAKTGIPICQPICPADAKDYVFFAEEKKCVCECPCGFKVDKVLGLYKCEPICPAGKSYWAEGGEGQECVPKCPDGWDTKVDAYGNKICERKCCGDEGIFFNGKCVCECEPGWKTEMINRVPMCVPLCECGSYWWEEGCEGGPGSCLEKCPDGWEEAKNDCGLDICKRKCCEPGLDIWFAEKDECVCDCPDGWEKAKVNDVWKCIEVCGCDEYWWKGCPEGASCVDKCPEGWKCDKGCADVDICSPQCCPTDKENIWFPEKQACVCECEDGWISKDVSGVPQCVKVCECDQFFWPYCEGACVEKCPEGWKCDKGCADVDLCVPKCPCDEKENIWFEAKGECTCECGPAWLEAEVNGVKQCVPACDCEEYWWCEGGDNGACLCECPEGWQPGEGCAGAKICTPKCCPTDKENIWWPEKGECVCDCAPGWTAQEVNGGLQCVRACKIGEAWWAKCEGEGACVCECPSGWTCAPGCEGVELCVPKCPADKPIWFDAIGECVCECEKGWTEQAVNGVPQCVHACDCDEYWWCEAGKEGTCVCSCPEGWKCDKGCADVDICSPQCCETDKENIWLPEKQECVCECPAGHGPQLVNSVLQCMPICPKGEFWWPGCDGPDSCLCECLEGWKCEKGCGDVDLCVPQCPWDCELNIWLPVEQKCVCECPEGYAKLKVNDLWQCEPICDCEEKFWCEGGKDGACVDKCPSGWTCEKGCGDIDLCHPICPCDAKDNIWFDAEHKCVCECPPGWVESELNSVKQCVHSCDCGDYWYPECEGACVDKCPVGWKCDKGCADVDICSPQCPCDSATPVWSPGSEKCVCDCCPGWAEQVINDVKQCAPVCECGDIWWCEGGAGGACVDKCPEGWKCDKGCDDIEICVPICPCDDKENIWFAEKHECVCECPEGWVKAEINKAYQCVKACDCGEYWWPECGPEGACVENCPEGWKCDKGCEYVDVCSPQCPCDAKENIWDAIKGECVCECADGYTSAKINDVWQCTPICEPGQYWWAAGKACVCECPSGWTWGSGCGGIDICVPVCDLNCPDHNFFELKSECIPCCPPGTSSLIVNYVPTCVTICPKDELWWCEGSEGGACVCECPVGWKAGEGPGCIPICERECDENGPDPVWFDEKGLCVCECPQGWTIDEVNKVKVCSHVCPKGEYWWQAGGKDGACVCECPEAWIPGTGCDGVDICIPQCLPSDEKNIFFNGECVCECPCGWHDEKVNDLAECKKNCPEGQKWWAAAQICVCECSDGWKCAQDAFGADICVPQCDLDCPERLWLSGTGCVCDCPPTHMINTVNKVLTCVEVCDEF